MALVGLQPAVSEARRDHGNDAREQLVAVSREHRELTRRLAATEDELEALRGRLAVVEASSGKPNEAPTGKSRDHSNTPPPERIEADLLAFRQKVLKAIASDLEAIDGRLTSAETRLDKTVTKLEYEKHKHTFVKPGHGWATKRIVDGCDDCLLPYLPPSKQGSKAVVSTSKPK
jgi:hypothetical protein